MSTFTYSVIGVVELIADLYSAPPPNKSFHCRRQLLPALMSRVEIAIVDSPIPKVSDDVGILHCHGFTLGVAAVTLKMLWRRRTTTQHSLSLISQRICSQLRVRPHVTPESLPLLGEPKWLMGLATYF